MPADFRFGEHIIFRGRPVIFRQYWPDRILSLVKFEDENKAASVRTIELRRYRPEEIVRQ